MNGSMQTRQPETSAEFYAKAGHLPASEAEWADQQATFRRWRADSRFEPYWPIIDGLLAKDFAATRPWAAAAQAAKELRDSGYDFEAWREQRAYDEQYAHDHLP